VLKQNVYCRYFELVGIIELLARSSLAELHHDSFDRRLRPVHGRVPVHLVPAHVAYQRSAGGSAALRVLPTRFCGRLRGLRRDGRESQGDRVRRAARGHGHGGGHPGGV